MLGDKVVASAVAAVVVMIVVIISVMRVGCWKGDLAGRGGSLYFQRA